MKAKKNFVLCSFVCILTMSMMLISCDMITGQKETVTKSEKSDVSYTSEANGTLKISNNTAKDMVVFIGQTPNINNVLGGVKAGSNRFFDISDDVDDFDVGGYIILRAMSQDEFDAKKSVLASAKIEFSAMATYGQGKKFSTEINPSYTGDYYFKVTNNGPVGIELRKDSPDGEKLGYLPALATNYTLYTNTTEGMSIFPVYVYYSKTSGKVHTVKSDSHFDSVTVAGRPLSDTSVVSIELPAQGVKWEDIVGNLSSPVAYISCTNNITNQGAYFTKAGTTRLKAQNGYDMLNPGELNTYEVQSTVEGSDLNLIVTLYNGQIKVPVKDSNGNSVIIKNGYDYNVTISYNGEGVQDSSNYSAIINQGEKRDISNEIESL